jgi:hypothetical protein
MIPTLAQALERLQQNPREAAQFDACSPPGTTRREAVIATLAAFAAKRAETEAMRAKLLAARQKVAALETAKLANERLRTSLAATKALVSAKQARRPAQPESAAATYSRLSRTDPIAAHKFYQENRLAILNPTPTH